MDSKTRMLKNWRFEEPDRVPLEIYLYDAARGLPGADRIAEFQEKEADNFRWVPGLDWGFCGLDSTYREEVVEDRPGDFRRMLRTHTTVAGEFSAITRHGCDEGDPHDFHWEKRFIQTVGDFRRLVDAPRERRRFDAGAYNAGCAKVGDRGLPATGLSHPMGWLVRNSTMEEVYGWLLTEERLVLAFQERCTEQIVDSLLPIREERLADPLVFMTHALEMFVPPWLGKDHFMRLVFPYDRRVNDAVHAVGGRHRAHAHGNTGAYLELFADMGIDGVEPLEAAPYGDNTIAAAKRKVGKRLLLSGNIPTPDFHVSGFSLRDLRDRVKRVIDEGAPGGGFSLKTTGGAVGNGKTREQSIQDINCNLALIDAWRDFGVY